MEDLVAVINSDLSRLTGWLQGKKLSLNIVKTQAMIIWSEQKLSHTRESSSVLLRFNLETEGIDLVN